MPVLILPAPIRSYVNGQRVVSVDGSNVAEAMECFLTQFPALRPHLTDANGKFRAFVNLFIGGNNIRDMQGLETKLTASDQLVLIFSIAGG